MKTWQSFTEPLLDGRLVRNKDNTAESELFFRRTLVAVLIVFLALLAVAGQLAYLQVIRHERFNTLSDKNRIRLQPLPPTRGFIFDRNGVLLADNLASYHLELIREQVKDLDKTLAGLGQRIELDEVDIVRFRKLFRRSPPYVGVPLRFRLTDEEMARLAVDLYRFPGVKIKADLTRRYPMGANGGHIVGYVGRINENEMRRIDRGQYRGSTHIGKTGVERYYEEILRGYSGHRQVETNAQGYPLRVLKRTSPTPGQHLHLSVDMRLQIKAEKILKAKRHNGAIVAIDPRNGEVLALASWPTYDPNPFVNGIDYASYRKLNTSKDRPLFNRALRGVYPPGSTIKPMMTLAGLHYGVVNRGSGVYCRGFYRLPGSKHKFRCWRRSGHGRVSMRRALSQSCDVYFYKLAHDLGINRIHEFLGGFRFGQLTGIDVYGEKRGLLPSRSWKRRIRKKDWFSGDTLSVGIGQGFFLATPLQLAHATAVVAQHGAGFKPRVVLATEHPGTRTKTLVEPQALPPIKVKNSRYWNAIIAGMIAVVEGGTAKKIRRGARYRMAGKTGTAQVFTLGQNQRYNARRLARHLLDHALFISFAPLKEPRIAVAVIVENGGGGSKTAAPMARELMDAYLLDQYDDDILATIRIAQEALVRERQ